MNIYDVLYSMNTGNATPKARPFDNLLGQALSGEGFITTATGNPVSIVTNKAQNAISTILSFSPKQSGSGDPSPQNIRPIEGWTEANLFGCGKNLFDKDSCEISRGHITEDGSIATNILGYMHTDTYTAIKGGGTYIFSGEIASATARNAVAFYDGGKNFISRYTPSTGGGATFTAPNNAEYIRFNLFAPYDTNTIQLELGSTATDYEPYTQGATITESLGGTYYGFEIDVEMGVLRNEWDYIAEYDGEELPGRWISDRDVYSPNTSPTIGSEVAYELATPLEIPLTPQTVALLSGNNTLWTDGDSLSVTYKARG